MEQQRSKTSLTRSLPGMGIALGAGAGIVVGVVIAGAPGIAVGAGVGAAAGLLIGAIARSVSERG